MDQVQYFNVDGIQIYLLCFVSSNMKNILMLSVEGWYCYNMLLSV